MLKILEKITSINFTLAKVSYGLFVLSIIIGFIIHNFVVTGCTDGSFGFDNCMFNGTDVSLEVTKFSWYGILLFVAGCFFTVFFKFFEIVTTQYNKMLNKDSTTVAPIN